MNIMKFKCIINWQLFLIVIIFQKILNVDGKRIRKKTIRSVCSDDTCNREGICYPVFLGVRCKCYKQYFSGDFCTEITDNCLQNVDSCISEHTEDCHSYFGSRFCKCNPGFYGRRCQNYGFYNISHASHIGLYLPRAIPVGHYVSMVMSYDTKEKTVSVGIEDNGLRINYSMNFFSPTSGWKNLENLLFSLNILQRVVGGKKALYTIHGNYYFALNHFVPRSGQQVLKFWSTIAVKYKEFTFQNEKEQSSILDAMSALISAPLVGDWFSHIADINLWPAQNDEDGTYANDQRRETITIKMEEAYNYEYYSFLNASCCTPQIVYLEGACSPYYKLPAVLLKNRMYQIGTGIVTQCGQFKSIKYKHAYLGKYDTEQMFSYNYMDGNSYEFKHPFTLSAMNQSILSGDKHQILLEVDEVQNNKNKVYYFGKLTCWLQYHIHAQPFLTINASQQVILSIHDIIYVEVLTFSPENIFEPYTDSSLSYEWTCSKISYGFYPEHTCTSSLSATGSSSTVYKIQFVYPIEALVEVHVCSYLNPKDTHSEKNCEKASFVFFAVGQALPTIGETSFTKFPFIVINCLRNCGGGTDGTTFLCDNREVVIFKGICKKRCHLIESFSWRVHHYLDTNFFTDETVKNLNKQAGKPALADADVENYAMLKAEIFPPSMPKAVVSLTFSYELDDSLASIYTLKFWHSPRSQNTPKYQDNCFQEATLVGRAYYDDFFICLDNVDPQIPCTYMFYQKGSEVGSEFGVLLGSAQVPFLSKVLLAAAKNSHVQVMVENDIFGTTYLDDYNFVDVLPPLERQDEILYKTFLQNIVEGKQNKEQKRLSLKSSVEANELSSFTQTAHFLIIEFANLRISENYSSKIEIIKYKRTITSSICNYLIKMAIPSPISVLQISSLLYEIIFINPSPIYADIANTIGTSLLSLGQSFENLVATDPLLRNKPQRVLKIIEPIIQITIAITTPAGTALNNFIDDYYILYLFGITYDEIKIMPDEEDLQPEKDNIETVTDKNILDNYISAVLNTMDGLISFLKGLLKTLEPFYDNEMAIFNPSLELIPSLKSYVYLFVRRDYIQNFNNKLFVQLPKSFPYAEFVSTQSGFDVSVATLTIPHVPFWWNALSSKLLPNMIILLLNIKENSEAMKHVSVFVNFQIKYRDEGYTKGVASQLPEQWTCHMFRLGSNAKNTLLITLKDSDNQPYQYELRVDEHSCPTNKSTVLINRGIGVFEYSCCGLSNVNEYTPLWVGVKMLSTEVGQGMYSIRISSFRCVDWKTEAIKIKSDWGSRCEPSSIDFQSETIKCRCDIPSLDPYYVGVLFLDLPNAISGFLPIDISYAASKQEKIVILFFIPIFLLIVMILACAFYFDKNEDIKKIPFYLRDNRKDEKYPYLVIIVTGGKSSRITTSLVYLKIYGSDLNSRKHALNDMDSNLVLRSRAVDYFILTTRKCLGRLRALEVWSDYNGPKPNWFCEKIVVRDIRNRVEWVFLVNKWLSINKGDGNIHRTLYQTKSDYLDFWERTLCEEDFKTHHIWYGMCVSKPCHPFTRKMKTLCAMSLTIVGEFIAVLFFGSPIIDKNASTDEGEFRFDLMVVNGFFGAIFATVVVYPLMYIIKNSPPNSNYNSEIYDFSGLDPSVSIPTYSLSYSLRQPLIITYIIIDLLLLIGTSVLCLPFGTKKLFMVLCTYIVVILMDAIIIESIHVLVRCLIWRGILKRNEMNFLCNEQINMKTEVFDMPPGRKNRKNKKYGFHTPNFDLSKQFPNLKINTKLLNITERQLIFQRDIQYKRFSMIVNQTFLMFFLALIVIIFSYLYRDPNSYYGVEVLRNIFIHNRYTKTTPLKNITSLDELYFYLNNTFLFAIHWQVPCWLLSTNYRLVNVVRLRQLRIRETPCYLPEFVNFDDNNDGESIDCSPELHAINKDTKTYSPYWNEIDENSTLPIRIKSLFVANAADKLRTHTFTTIYRFIPTDGYVACLARTFMKAREVLNEIKTYGWIDKYTRIILIEFTVFNPHANLIYVVTICIEMTITGTYIVTDHIYPVKLVQQTTLLKVAEYIITIIMVILAIGLILYKIVEFLKTISVKLSYQSVVEILADIIFSVIVIDFAITLLARSKAISKIIVDVQITKNTEFLSFNDVGFLDYKCKFLLGLIGFLMTIRYAYVFISFGVFEKIKNTLETSFATMVSLCALFVISAAIVSLVLYLVLGNKSLFWWDLRYYANPDLPGMTKFLIISTFFIFHYLFKPLFIAVFMNACRSSRNVRVVENPISFETVREFLSKKFCPES